MKEEKPTTFNTTDVLSVIGVAKFLGVSKDTIYELVRQNKIPHRHVGKQPRFPVWLIVDWFNKWEGGISQ